MGRTYSRTEPSPPALPSPFPRGTRHHWKRKSGNGSGFSPPRPSARTATRPAVSCVTSVQEARERARPDAQRPTKLRNRIWEGPGQSRRSGALQRGGCRRPAAVGSALSPETIETQEQVRHRCKQHNRYRERHGNRYRGKRQNRYSTGRGGQR